MPSSPGAPATDSAPAEPRTGTRVELRGVSKVFGSGKKATRALDDVTLSVEPGRVLGVIGYSGAGKSTLIRLINGLETPSSGEVLLDGTDIAGMKKRKLREVRRDIGMIFQQFNLFTSRTVAGALTGLDRVEKIVRIDERGLDMRAEGRNLFLEYSDAPGALGKVGSQLGEAGVNIEAAALTQAAKGDGAILILRVDAEVPASLEKQIAESLGASASVQLDLN